MMACSSKPSVSTRIWRFLPLTFLPASSPCGSMQPPFFRALHALAIDDGGGRAGFSFALLPTRHIKRVPAQHTFRLSRLVELRRHAGSHPADLSGSHATGIPCSKYT